MGNDGNVHPVRATESDEAGWDFEAIDQNSAQAIPSEKKKRNPPVRKKDPGRPRVGVVLGSEGIKAFAALPLIEALQSENIQVDLVVGCGGGALLAALWGAGYDMRQISSLFAKAHAKELYSDYDINAIMSIPDEEKGRFHLDSAILRPHGLQRVYEAIFKDQDISSLSHRTMLVTTDAMSGRSVQLESGNLAQAVYASGAMYPLMPPARIGGRLLMDGGFRSPLPVLQAVRENMDVIIAVYFEDAVNPEPSGFAESFLNTTKMYRRSLIQSQLPMAISMHYYEIIPVYVTYNRPLQIWEAERIKEIIHLGRLAVQDRLGLVKEAIQQFPECGLLPGGGAAGA
ncbi:MAG: patatin-like phospholipase family protein [Desulfovibrio sp.]|uniref:patatin-like phospholipase family protein n=1 Tax=Desulfovibrio sp. 7SRBS1 TaxID=3378064 RepID=UPI003B3D2EBD